MQASMAIRQIIGKRIVFDCTETIDSATLRLCDSHRSSRYKMQQNDFIAHDQGRALHAGGATGAALRPEGGLIVERQRRNGRSRARALASTGAPRSMKMGNIASPWRYHADADARSDLPIYAQLAIPHYAR
jgi:hypothetical protein